MTLLGQIRTLFWEVNAVQIHKLEKFFDIVHLLFLLFVNCLSLVCQYLHWSVSDCDDVIAFSKKN